MKEKIMRAVELQRRVMWLALHSTEAAEAAFASVENAIEEAADEFERAEAVRKQYWQMRAAGRRW